MPHAPLPTVPFVTAAEVRLLEAPKVSGKGSGTGWRFVYTRSSPLTPTSRSPGADWRKRCEVCRTYRVRLKKQCDAAGRNVYEEFTGGWTDPREAARFVAGLLKLRYGEHWAAQVKNGRPKVFDIFQDEDDRDKWWLMAVVAGRKRPLDNPDTEDGCFHSKKHAAWFVKEWAAAKFGEAGLSALGFDPVPADARTDAAAVAAMPKTPPELSLHWLPLFAGAG